MTNNISTIVSTGFLNINFRRDHHETDMILFSSYIKLI